MTSQSTKEHDDSLAFQSPFVWKYCPTKNNLIIVIEEKLNSLDEDNQLLLHWSRFIFNLVLCYEYFKETDIKNSIAALNDCENDVSYVRENYCNEKHLCVMGKGLQRIISNCRLYIQQSAKSSEIDIKYIQEFESLSAEDEASVWGVRAAVAMEYGQNGIEDAVRYSRKGVELVPECGEWNFLVGKALARQRRMFRCNDEKKRFEDEITFLQKAVDIIGSLASMELLAQSYMEFCKAWNSRIHGPCTHCEKSAELYRRVLEAGKDRAHVNVRCANGFLKLHPGFRDLELAEECVLRSLQLSPDNVTINYTAGLYYMKIKDIGKAKKYLIKAAEGGAYFAHIELIKIKMIENKRYDAIADLENLLEKYPELEYTNVTLAELGIYMNEVHRNYAKAKDYWERIPDGNSGKNILESFFSILCPSKRPYNIIEIMQKYERNKTGNGSRKASTEENWRIRMM